MMRKNALDRAYMFNQMIDSGMFQSEIAQKFGISRQAVNQALNTHKQAVRKKTRYMIKTGKIIKPEACSRCKEVKPIEAHHRDYGEADNIIWLCSTCHHSLHL